MGAVAYSNGVELAVKAFLGNFSRIFDAHSNLLKDAGVRSMPERVCHATLPRDINGRPRLLGYRVGP